MILAVADRGWEVVYLVMAAGLAIAGFGVLLTVLLGSIVLAWRRVRLIRVPRATNEETRAPR